MAEQSHNKMNDDEGFPKPPHPSDRPKTRQGFDWIRWGIVTLFILLLLVMLVGLIREFGLPDLSPRSLPLENLSKSSIEIVDVLDHSAGAKAVLLVNQSDLAEIRLVDVVTGAQEFVTPLDISSAEPVVSPTMQRVAFFTVSSGQRTLMVGSPQEKITATISNDSLAEAQWARARLCDDAPIHWSPDGTHVASFVCAASTGQSYVVISEVGGPNRVLEQTVGSLTNSRTLTWSSANQVLYSRRVGDSDVIYVLDVDDLDNEPRRLFGP